MRWARVGMVAMVAAGAAAATAPTAGAATVQITQQSPATEAPKGGGGSPATARVEVTALPGEANRITATRGAGNALVLRDPSAPLSPAGAGCAATGPGEVTCTPGVGPATTLAADLGDGDDLVDVTAAAGLELQADGGPGDDVLRAGSGLRNDLRPGPGRDEVDGAPGALDTVYYDERTAPVTITLDGSQPSGEAGEGDVLAGIERAIGGAGDDRLIGSAGDDGLYGNDGADRVDGGAGNDSIGGGRGDDVLDGGAGNDDIGGGAGADAITGGTGDDDLSGGFGADRVDGGEGDDDLSLTGDPAEQRGDVAICGAGRDRADSPAAFEEIDPDCERVDIAVAGMDVVPLRVLGPPRLRGGRIVLRLRCDHEDCGDRTRGRVTIGGARAAFSLRRDQTATLRLPRRAARRGRRVRVVIAARQLEGGDGVPVRSGYFTRLG
jgi:hypothetical protein